MLRQLTSMDTWVTIGGIAVGAVTAKLTGRWAAEWFARGKPWSANQRFWTEQALTLGAGAAQALIVGFLPFRGAGRLGRNLLIGGGVAVLVDLIDKQLLPALGLGPKLANGAAAAPALPAANGSGTQGYGDYVQMPLRQGGSLMGPGVGDYIQMPLPNMAGLGAAPSQAMVEAGEFGAMAPSNAMVEAGEFGNMDPETFSPSF